jgi:hypothetical protein
MLLQNDIFDKHVILSAAKNPFEATYHSDESWVRTAFLSKRHHEA